MLTYCVKCLYPSTKPDLTFGKDGICSACSNYDSRDQIDWAQRSQDFQSILNQYKSSGNYDCIVPVSGGKDSTYQVVTLLEHGAKPLCVTATTDSLSELGRKNIENIKSLGVDYLEFTFNPKLRRRINKFCLEKLGDISWPEHVTIFTLPIRIAVALNIKLVVWGENPQNEYGGPAASTQNKTLNRRWLEEFGGLLGLRVTDLKDILQIDPKDLINYSYPSQDELDRVGVTGVFLGYYFPWDGYNNAEIAKKHGFSTFHKNVEGSICDYENLDNHQTGIHDYFKFLKYGFGRATDIACNHIRRGRLDRKTALEQVLANDGKFPWTCLDKRIEEILAEIGMDLNSFVKVCDQFTNKKIFLCDEQGNLKKDKDLNLTKLNYDNV
jgi:N-acetyl sugar amidotransferase